MRLKEYIKLIKNKVWIIILTTILFMISAGIITSYFITPVYEANTTLIVDINQSQENIDTVTGDKLNSSQKLTVIYGEIIKSRAVLGKVADELNLNISGDEIRGKVTISQIKDTQMMNISVLDKNPKQAKDIANTIPVIFKEEAKRIVKANDVKVIDKALQPTIPLKPNSPIVVSMSGIIGFMTGIFAILGMEYMNSKVKTSNDIQSNLNLHVLGVIPYRSKLKIKKYNKNSNTDEIYRSIRTEIIFSKSNHNIKSILITSSKKNEGKTTVITSVAKSFSKLEDKRILIIDSNMKNPSMHKIFNLDNIKGLSDLLQDKFVIQDCIQNINTTTLDVLVAGECVVNSSELLSLEKFRNLIEELKEKYDYIFIDSPSIDTATDASLISSFVDGTILLTGYDEVEIDICKLSKEKLEYVDANIIGVILNKFKR
ncbi:MAG: polysaccharide biosynthesis tyrosine autokinase [Peptostreptococcaceae bacterium]